MKRDLEHLKLLTVFHFILAGMVAVVGSFFIFYVVMGIMMINGTFPGPRPGAAGGPPPFLGWFMLGMGAFMILLCWTQAICLAIAGYCLSRRKKWLFCCVVAGISCLNAPLGTALGVCTLLVLLRPTVKDLFAGRIIEPRDPEDWDDDEPVRRQPPRRARMEDRDEDSDGRRPPKEEAPPRRDDDRFTSER